MSTTIDRSVVELQFDNKQFEQGISTTMSSLDKFKQNLKFNGATRGLEEVNGAIRNVNMSGLGGAVEAVSAKFSALSVMGVTALANITNSAVNAGKRIVSALTIDPIKSGFSEYETKIGSIQTILANTASKGTTMEDVTRVIGELNTYADKTIYNFAEMTRNIGTFTAAGVGLEESATAIQGIANLAAVSGSNSQQASTAMYQLSQAMASGTVKLMDWNSVVNAGMGGQVFQDALKATAKAHGVAVDELIEKNGSFRDSLSEGWITTEILTETLAKMTKSGAAEYLSDLTGVELSQIEAAQKLVANNKDGSASYDELAKKLAATGKISQTEAVEILKMADNAEDAATKVKTFTQLWDTLKEAAQSGWSQSWEIIVGDFEEAKEFLTELSETFGGIIGKSAEARNEVLQGWKDLGGRTALIDAFRNAFEAVASVVKPIKEAFNDIFPPVTAKNLLAFTEGLRDLMAKLKLSDTASENVKRTFKGLFAVVDILRQVFVAVVKAIFPLGDGVGKLGGGILGVTAAIGDFLVGLSNSIKKSDVLNGVFQGIAKAVSKVIGFISDFIGFVTKNFVFPGFEILHTFLGKLYDRFSQIVGGAQGMGDSISEAFSKIGDSVSGSAIVTILKAVWSAIVAISSGIGKALSSLAEGLSGAMGGADFDGFLDFVRTLITGGLGVGLIKIFNNTSDAIENFGGIFESVKEIFGGVQGCLESFQNQLKAGTLLKIASAVGILALSILVLSAIDGKKLASSLGAITVLFADLAGSMALFGKIGYDKGALKSSAVMIALSVAILILSSALKKISTIDSKQLGTGLFGIVSLMATMIAAVKILGSGGNTIVKGAAQMIALAIAVKILASACADLGQLSPEELGKGLIGVLGILSALALFTAATSGSSGMLSTGVAMIALGAAMKIFASACADFGQMSWESIAKGLVGMAGALVAIVAALHLMPSNMLVMGVGLLAVSGALAILASVMVKLGGMSWEEIAKGLLTLGGSIAILALGLYAMTGTMAGAAALLIAAAALAVLAPVLALLGAMSWEGIVKGLVSLAGTFLILGVAGYALAPVVPVILGLAAALALIGVGVLAFGAGLLAAGAGLTALATGLTALAAVGVAAAASIVATLEIILTGIIGLIPAVLAAVGEGIIAICDVIAGSVDSICAAVTAILLAVIGALEKRIPALLSCVGVLLEELLAFIVKYVPKIAEAALELISGFLDGIARGLPKVINSAINLVIKFINGMADGIRNNTPRMISAVNNLMDAVMEAIAAWFKNAVTKGRELTGKISEGVKNGISGLKQAGKDAIQGFINGIKEKLSAAAEAAKSVGKAALNGIKKFLNINSPSKKFIPIGKSMDEGLIVGLKAFAGKVATGAKDVGKGALSAMKGVVSGIADSVNNDLDSQPTIRPVVDLSGVRTGLGAIDSMLARGSYVDVSANVGTVSAMMKRYNRSGGNGDVVSAINDLRKDIGKIQGNSYNVGDITYDDGSNVSDAVKAIVRAVKVERRT